MTSTPPAQPSRFKTPSNLTTQERLSTNTVGLVALSDFRKRRAEVLEQQEREAREALRPAAAAAAAASGTNTPRSRSETPAVDADGGGGGGGGGGGAEKKVKKRKKKALVSFGDEEEELDTDTPPLVVKKKKKTEEEVEELQKQQEQEQEQQRESTAEDEAKSSTAKLKANAAVGVVPRALTKAALRREAAEREALRKEFLVLQEAVKNTEIAVPFVFYDGTNIPGGTVRVRKGEFVWVFLDKSRKVGAQRRVGVGRNSNVRREWARVGVDDLLLVRGTMIIPHHYEFYFFIMNKTVGPGNVRLFNYSAEAPPPAPADSLGDENGAEDATASSLSKGGIIKREVVDINLLEGANDDPTFTKVVDRRWYERNKHIYPASVWQEFDPEKDYTSEVRKDTGGNTFFFSK